MRKKILTLMAAALAGMSASAQGIVVYDGDTPVGAFKGTDYKVVFSDPQGPEYVEITLADGTTKKWAKWNLGASAIAESPEKSFGDYYAWGATETWYKEGTITWTIDWETAKITGTVADADWKSPYSDGYVEANTPSVTGTTLSSTEDVVKIKYSGWHIPTKQDFINLIQACVGTGTEEAEATSITTNKNITEKGIYLIKLTSERSVTIDGETYKVPGALFVTSASDISKRVFFPAAGFSVEKEFNAPNENLYTSSESKIDDDGSKIPFMMAFKGYGYVQVSAKDIPIYLGFPIRPVSD